MKLERFQRVFAAFVGLVISGFLLVGTFRDPDPRAQLPMTILFRVALCGFLLFAFGKRAAGKQLASISWCALALFLVGGIWEVTTLRAYVARIICGGLAVTGGLIEYRLERAARATSSSTPPDPA